MKLYLSIAVKFFLAFNVNIGTLWVSDRQSAKVLKPLMNDR